MLLFDVYLTMATEERIVCGQIAVKDPDDQGRLSSQFRYSEAYLENPKAFALDPVHLPLNSRIFTSSNPRTGLHGVFEDALPDRWGQKVLSRNPAILSQRKERGLRSRMRAPEMLEYIGFNGLGALSFALSGRQPATFDIPPWADLDHHRKAAWALENEEGEEWISETFWSAGSPSGGARPKVLLSDALVKFPSKNDDLPILEMEFFAMSLAEQIGLPAAKTHLLQTEEKSLHVLAVDRFDKPKQSRGRYHQISFETLLGIQSFNHQCSYGDLAEVIKNYSADFEDDLRHLYRQMVFNALIGNTDDHLKNFSMMHDGLQGYRLTPAYDLVPYMEPEHSLRFDLDYYPPDRSTFLKIGQLFNLDDTESGLLLDQVADETALKAPELLDQVELTSVAKDRMKKHLEKRLANSVLKAGVTVPEKGGPNGF